MFKKYYNTQQHDTSDCAAAVISTILLTYGYETSIMKIREIIGTDSFGTSINGIVHGLESLNFTAKAVRVALEDVSQDLSFPAILHVHTQEGLNHFLVVHKISKKHIYFIADPSKEGIQKLTFETLQKQYTGIAVFMIPNSEFEAMATKDKGIIELFKTLIYPQKKLLFTVILTSLLLSVFGILSSMFSKVIMDEVIPYQLKSSLYVFLIVFGIVSIIQNIMSAFRQHVLLYLSRKIDIPLLLGYYDHILHLPYFFFSTRRVGDIITRFQDAMTIKDIFTSVSISLLMDVLLAMVASVFLWNISSSLFLILCMMVGVNIVLVYIFKKPYKDINLEQMEAGAMLNSQLIESIQNIETVKASGDEKQQIERLEHRFITTLEIGFKEGKLQNTQGFVSGVIASLGNLIFMGAGAIYIMNQTMSIGDLLVFQTLSQYFTEPVQSLVTLQISFQEAQIAMKRLREVMSLNREDQTEKLRIKPDLSGDIVFKDITFGYGFRTPIIKNLHVAIKQGEKVAFVGESGAGKSTLARLLLKFMELSEGSISIADYDIQVIDSTHLRHKIAYIPQNIELFTGSIIENLKVGNPQATYEEILVACRKAGADTFINRMPNRYASFIEEGGSNLSGGEKQRIAIARALLKNPDVYVFDEATSNLDSFSEQQIQNLLFNHIKNQTTIIIAHRLSTISKCDRIFFMEKGAIVEQGSHEELMSQKGKYAAMISLQNQDTYKNLPTSSKHTKKGAKSYE